MCPNGYGNYSQIQDDLWSRMSSDESFTALTLVAKRKKNDPNALSFNQTHLNTLLHGCSIATSTLTMRESTQEGFGEKLIN